MLLNTVADLCNNFLEPFRPFLNDDEVTDIHRNGNGTVFTQVRGRKQQVECSISEEKLTVAIQVVGRLSPSKSEINRNAPIMDIRLPDGSRVNAVLSPPSLPGACLSIRKFQMNRFSLSELVRIGSVNATVAENLAAAVANRESILIAGATGSGKTTLLNALLNMIDPEDRLCVVEDTEELQVGNIKNVVRMVERKRQKGVEPVTMRELLKATLRQKPDRIIVGEVRGAEAIDLLTAMSTGHDGTISTTHANNAEEALDRLVDCCRMAGDVLPVDVLQSRIAKSLRYVVHLGKDMRVTGMISVEGVAGGQFKTRQLWP